MQKIKLFIKSLRIFQQQYARQNKITQYCTSLHNCTIMQVYPHSPQPQLRLCI